MSAALGRMDVREDGTTARLLACAKATRACEALPGESARTLVQLAGGVRLYLQARQRRLALGALDDIERLMQGVDDADLRDAYDELVGKVRDALGVKHQGWKSRAA